MLSLLRDAESSLFVFRRKALGIFAQMEEFPANPTFEATPSNKHKTFCLYLKRTFFFQCFTSRLEAQAAPSLGDFLTGLLLWEFAIQLRVLGMQPLDVQNSTGIGS